MNTDFCILLSSLWTGVRGLEEYKRLFVTPLLGAVIKLREILKKADFIRQDIVEVFCASVFYVTEINHSLVENLKCRFSCGVFVKCTDIYLDEMFKFLPLIQNLSPNVILSTLAVEVALIRKSWRVMVWCSHFQVWCKLHTREDMITQSLAVLIITLKLKLGAMNIQTTIYGKSRELKRNKYNMPEGKKNY